jgi:hypothetical protein
MLSLTCCESIWKHSLTQANATCEFRTRGSAKHAQRPEHLERVLREQVEDESGVKEDGEGDGQRRVEEAIPCRAVRVDAESKSVINYRML